MRNGNMDNKAFCQKHQFWYDPMVTGGVCPECAAEAGGARGIEDYGSTEPVYGMSSAPIGVTEPAPGGGFEGYGHTEPAQSGGFEGYGHTEPAQSGGFDGFGRTEPAPGGGFDGYGKTEPAVGFIQGGMGYASGTPGFPGFPGDPADLGQTLPPSSFPEIEQYDGTKPSFEAEQGIAPVVGWLVCTAGVNRGKDYKIHPENNFIGRLPSNDICIEGDDKIGRESNVMIVYDSQDRLFYIGSPSGKNIVRLNGKPVLEAKELHAYDEITVGATKLLFVPFCGERFGWDE